MIVVSQPSCLHSTLLASATCSIGGVEGYWERS